MVEGWILDIYPGRAGEMVIWLKTGDGHSIRLTDKWYNSIYVACDEESGLEYLLQRREIQYFIHDTTFVQRRENVTDYDKKKVLKIRLGEADDATKIAEIIESLASFSYYRLYNADLLPAQTYMFDKGLFTLAYVNFEKIGEEIRWELLDSIESKDYKLPPLRKMKVSVKVANKGVIPHFDDPIDTIRIANLGEDIVIASGSEVHKLGELVRAVERIDPDIIFFDQGDEFTTHYLTERANANGILNKFVLSRDRVSWKRLRNRGTSYFAYGRILYTPTSQPLFGRINLDSSNHGFEGSGFDGLLEIMRICRMPLHKGSRASIGKCLSSMQFYHAYKDDLLVPWKPLMNESYKNGNELLIGDRGGFIFEPKVGVYEDVGEIDFSSLYPTIMLKHNISAETVLCECCPTSKNTIPELNYNICEKRLGIVPKSLSLVLQKRADYKKLRNKTSSPEQKMIYASRINALKGILVCCFGYLSYRNAKFGRIDSHMAVCAFARKILLDTVRIIERRGFEVIHGIVDSLWIKKRGADKQDFLELSNEIESELDFPLSLEGIYKWIAFLTSRMYDDVPVLNRYFGAFEDGSMKLRGIEVRRRDTIKLVADCEEDILKLLGSCDDLDEVKEKIPQALRLLESYVNRLKRGAVPMSDLIIVNQLSKNHDQYVANTPQALASRQLVNEGLALMAGQSVAYVITNHKAKNPTHKIQSVQLLNQYTRYDVGKYLELLIRGVSTILKPFGYDEESLHRKLAIGHQSNL